MISDWKSYIFNLWDPPFSPPASIFEKFEKSVAVPDMAPEPRKPLDVRFAVPVALRPEALTPVQDAEPVSGEVDTVCEMPIFVKFMGHYKLQHLMSSTIWVGIPAIKPHIFNANQNAETMELLDKPDREMPGSEHKGKLVHLTSTWLLLTCSLLPFGKFIGKDPGRRGDLLSFSPSFHILP